MHEANLPTLSTNSGYFQTDVRARIANPGFVFAPLYEYIRANKTDWLDGRLRLTQNDPVYALKFCQELHS